MPATLPAHPPPPDRRRWASRLSRSAWHRAIAGNQLEPLFPNVARLWGSPATLPQRALAAVWATHPGTMASHRTSAALWGVERPGDDPIDVMMPDRTRYSRVRGVVVHRPRDLLDMRPVMRDQVPTTNPLRMLVTLTVDATLVAIHLGFRDGSRPEAVR